MIVGRNVIPDDSSTGGDYTSNHHPHTPVKFYGVKEMVLRRSRKKWFWKGSTVFKNWSKFLRGFETKSGKNSIGINENTSQLKTLEGGNGKRHSSKGWYRKLGT